MLHQQDDSGAPAPDEQAQGKILYLVEISDHSSRTGRPCELEDRNRQALTVHHF